MEIGDHDATQVDLMPLIQPHVTTQFEPKGVANTVARRHVLWGLPKKHQIPS